MTKRSGLWYNAKRQAFSRRRERLNFIFPHFPVPTKLHFDWMSIVILHPGLPKGYVQNSSMQDVSIIHGLPVLASIARI